MSEKRMFTVGYVEYPETTLIYRTLKINVEDYPELEGKSDDEIIDYIKENASKMKATDDESYFSLYDELQDQDIVREKIPHVGSEIWAELADDDDEEDDDENDDDYED
jgi:hypothetical protein